jgi:hypothetical protein
MAVIVVLMGLCLLGVEQVVYLVEALEAQVEVEVLDGAQCMVMKVVVEVQELPGKEIMVEAALLA